MIHCSGTYKAMFVQVLLQEQMRLEVLMKEEAQLTFKPSVNQYHDVRAQLNLRHPEAYLAQVTAKRQAQLAQRLEERRSREVLTYDFPLCTQLSLPVAVTMALF